VDEEEEEEKEEGEEGRGVDEDKDKVADVAPGSRGPEGHGPRRSFSPPSPSRATLPGDSRTAILPRIQQVQRPRRASRSALTMARLLCMELKGEPFCRGVKLQPLSEYEDLGCYFQTYCEQTNEDHRLPMI
jgi:hypothetical protein